MQELISRTVAKERGLTQYFTGKPCVRGHIAPRWLANGRCIECHKQEMMCRRNANPEKEKQRNRSQYQKHKEKRRKSALERYYADLAKAAERAREYRLKSPHKYEYSKRWKALNRSRIKEYDRSSLVKARKAEWAKNNKEAVNAKTRLHRARKRGNDGQHTAADIAEIMKMQRGRCAMPWCRKLLRSCYHVDHIVPSVMGGSNNRENIQLLCVSCNTSKGGRDPLDFSRSQGCLL